MAAMNFPNAPAVGELYPPTAVVGLPQYRWDGLVWKAEPYGAGSFVLKAGDTMTGALVLPGDPVAALDAAPKQYVDTKTTVNATPLDAMAYNGMQVNGGLQFDQLYCGVAQPIPHSNNIRAADCWQGAKGPNGSFTVTRVGTGSFQYFAQAFRFAVGTAVPSPATNDYATISQWIEGIRVLRLMWGKGGLASPITIGFWAHSSLAGLHGGAVMNATGDRCYVFQFTMNSANNWEWKTVTIPGCPDGVWEIGTALGMVVSFCMGAHSNLLVAPGAWVANVNVFGPTGQVNLMASTSHVFYVTGLVVLPGTLAPTAAQSPLLARPYDEEISLVQRYYEKSYALDMPLGTVSNNGAANEFNQFMSSAGQLEHVVYMSTTKRGYATIMTYSPATGASGAVRSAIGVDQGGIIYYFIGHKSFVVRCDTATYGMNFHWTADARL